MKKMIFLISIIVIMIGLLFLFYRKPESIPKIEKIKEKAISGIVIKTSDDLLNLKYQNKIYGLPLSKTEELSTFIPGDFIRIIYEGEWDFNQEVQDVNVKKIIYENKEHEESYKRCLFDEGIFKDHYEKAYTKLKEMTLEEKIGQIFFVRVPLNATEVVKQKQFGGYILFGQDTKGKRKENIQHDIASWNKVSKIPLLIGTDEEGGTVVRVSNNPLLAPNKFLSPQEIYQKGGMDAIKEDNKNKNQLLYELGINVNLAPVADISMNRQDYMYKRSFGKDAAETSNFVKSIIESSKGTNVSNTLKHFPGYGNNVDTHTGISRDQRTLENFRKYDFLPFKAGIESGAESVLVSHNILVNIEDLVPASLSLKIHNILRNELGFTGIIMTDDLAMDAIHDYVENPNIEALKAGNDLIIITDYEKGIHEIKEALNQGMIRESLLDNSVLHVLAWKYYKGLL